METNIIETMIEKNTPFAVIQYFTSLKTDPETQNKEYEIMYVRKELVPKLIDGKPVMENGKQVKVKKKVIKYQRIEGDLLRYFVNNVRHFKQCVNDINGRVYEYNGFKSFVIKNVEEDYR